MTSRSMCWPALAVQVSDNDDDSDSDCCTMTVARWESESAFRKEMCRAAIIQ